jgi:hypothetical protein
MAGKLSFLALCVISLYAGTPVKGGVPLDPSTLMTGTLVSQGNTKKEALGSIPEKKVEQVKVI